MSVNTIKTAALLALLSAVLIVGGGAISGRNGMYIGLTLAVVMNFSSYFFSDKIALMSYAAQPVSESQNPEVYRRVAPIVRNLCQRMGLPMPKLWIIPEDSPNAFATGRNPAARLRGLHLRHPANHGRPRDRRRRRPRARPRAASRYPHQLRGRHARRRHHPAGAHRLLVRGRFAPRRPRRRRSSARSP